VAKQPLINPIAIPASREEKLITGVCFEFICVKGLIGNLRKGYFSLEQ
jgi:hypothetical protein